MASDRSPKSSQEMADHEEAISVVAARMFSSYPTEKIQAMIVIV